MDFEETFPLRVCINLDRRPDRWSKACDEFARAGLTVHRWPAVDGQKVRRTHGYAWASRYALSLTKRLIVRNAARQKAKGVFFFEDDVVLHPEWRRRVESLTLPADWGILLLGCQHLARPEPVVPGLVRTFAAVDNHAVGIRGEWFERILYTLSHGREDARIWPHTASDRHLASLMREIPTYVAWPNLAWQRVAMSDQTHTRYSLYDATGVQTTNRHLLRNVEEVWETTHPNGGIPNRGPWMHAQEVAFIKSVLTPQMTVLEYGCGGSTVCFGGLVAAWHAIEHDAGWFRRMRAEAQGKNVFLQYVPPAWPPQDAFSAAQTGQYADYVKAGALKGLEFDAVLIDGRSRVDCALQASAVMKPGAWLFFHDYFSRARYLRRAKELNPLFRMVKEFRRTPQTMAVFRRR